MKYLFLLLLLPFCFSCSNDDENYDSNATLISPEEKLIGTWQYFKYEEGGFSWELDECEKQITYQFFETGELTAELYLKNNADECLHQTAFGHWVYLSSKDKFEIGLDATGTSKVKVVFSENNTVLTINNIHEGELVDSFSFFKR